MAISFRKKIQRGKKKDLLLWYNVTKQEIMLSTLPDTDLQALIGLIVSDFQVSKVLRPFYTKLQHQGCDNSAMMLAILFSFRSIKLLLNKIATHFRDAPLFSIRTELLVSSQSCRRIDADAWCKRVPNIHKAFKLCSFLPSKQPVKRRVMVTIEVFNI